MIGIGDKGSAHQPHIFAAGHLFQLPYAKGLADLAGHIGQQCKREIVFCGKLAMRIRTVEIDAHHSVTHAGKFGIAVAE